MVHYAQPRRLGWSPFRPLLGQVPFTDIVSPRGRQKTIAVTTSVAMLGAATWAFTEMATTPKKKMATQVALGAIGAGLAMSGLLTAYGAFD